MPYTIRYLSPDKQIDTIVLQSCNYGLLITCSCDLRDFCLFGIFILFLVFSGIRQ